jgi:predicted GIY-YIG superfamily endonuclease
VARIRSVKPTLFGSELLIAEDHAAGVPTSVGSWGASRQTIVYRFFDASMTLLYVGVTWRPAERWTSHRNESPWWRRVAFLATETLPSMTEALAVERRAIGLEWPLFNVRSV